VRVLRSAASPQGTTLLRSRAGPRIRRRTSRRRCWRLRTTDKLARAEPRIPCRTCAPPHSRSGSSRRPPGTPMRRVDRGYCRRLATDRGLCPATSVTARDPAAAATHGERRRRRLRVAPSTNEGLERETGFEAATCSLESQDDHVSQLRAGEPERNVSSYRVFTEGARRRMARHSRESGRQRETSSSRVACDRSTSQGPAAGPASPDHRPRQNVSPSRDRRLGVPSSSVAHEPFEHRRE
jgi:hypothetical protein